MKMANIYDDIKSGMVKRGSQAVQLGWSLWRILSLSLADDRIAPMHALSVVLERGSISVVYASRFLSRIKIKGMRRYSFEKEKYPTPENMVSAVNLAANEFRAAHAQVILVIPKSWTIIKKTELPLSVMSNLSGVMTYELDRLTPIGADRAFFDFQIIGQDENHVHLMITAVNREMIKPYVDTLREKKISLNRITISSSTFGTLSDYALGGGNIVFAVVDHGRYEGGLIRDHQWYASFSGEFDQKSEPMNIRIIAGEINSLIEGLDKKKAKIDVVLDWRLSDSCDATLKESIHAPVYFIGKIDLKLRFLNKDNLQELPYLAAGGALEHLCPGKAKMNLLDQGRHPQIKTAMSLTIILLVVLAALGLFWVLSPLQIEQWKVEAINREIASRKETVRKVEIVKKELQNMEKEMTSIRTFKYTRPMVLNLIKEITRILPKNTWLTRIRITDSIIEIEGYAASATEIVSKLEVSEYFKKVEFASSTSRDTRLNADRFIIKMETEGLPGEKVKDEKKK